MQIPKARQGLYRRKHGKIKGLQDNYTAESMGALQVLIGANPETDLHICIDNQGVVKRWEKDMRTDPRARSRASARAIWNRIEHMKEVRKKAGSKTIVSWIHSHVEKDKQDGVNKKEETTEGQGKQTTKHKSRPSLFSYSSKGKQGETNESRGKKEGGTGVPQKTKCVCGEETCRKEHL